MGQKGHVRKKYPSDLTDEQWAILGPMIPPAKQNERNRFELSYATRLNRAAGLYVGWRL